MNDIKSYYELINQSISLDAIVLDSNDNNNVVVIKTLGDHKVRINDVNVIVRVIDSN